MPRLSGVAPLLPGTPAQAPCGPFRTPPSCAPLCSAAVPPVDRELRESRGLSDALCALLQPPPELSQGPAAVHLPTSTLTSPPAMAPLLALLLVALVGLPLGKMGGGWPDEKTNVWG